MNRSCGRCWCAPSGAMATAAWRRGTRRKPSACSSTTRPRSTWSSSDVVMPGMSGGGLGDRLALLRPDLPVLYTSAYVDEDVIGRGLLEEGLPFLQKPCTPRELARKVREVLDG